MTTTNHITVDGLRVAYVEEGAGEPVILLHGYPQNHLAWRHQLTALAKSHRVIAIDWPGWGESERPASVRYDDEVGRLGRILDALKIERCNLFGHDYGGYIALGFVAAHPERVLRLAILDSRAHETYPRISWWATWGRGWLARHMPGMLSKIPFADSHRKGLAIDVAAGCFDKALVEKYVGWMDAPEAHAWFVRFYADYELRPRRELLPALAELKIPTAVIWGDFDAWCPAAIGRELAATIPDATLLEIPNGLHFVMEHKPDLVTAELDKLLALPPAPIQAAPAKRPPAPARESEIVRGAVLAGWAWFLSAALIALGAVGLFTDQIGPMPTNRAHALLLDLGVGFAGYAFARFELERIFVIAFALGSIAVGILGLVPATSAPLYGTFHLDTWSSYSQLVGGGLSLVMWLAFRPRPV